MSASDQVAQAVTGGSLGDILLKGGLGMAVACLLGLVLYLSFEERQEDRAVQKELLTQLITQCFELKDQGQAMGNKVDNLYDFFGVEPLNVEAFDSELELQRRLADAADH